MLFEPKEPTQEKNDFFDGPDIPEAPKEPKKPSYTPEDPDYWDNDDNEWEHLRPRKKTTLWIWLGCAVLGIALLATCWLRYFSPYVEDATQYGYVEHIEKRGTVFKTYEGILLPYKELHDTTRLYTRDFIFTAADKKVAAKLYRAQTEGRPVRVEYKSYHATLPWRGSSKIIITAVDSVKTSTILPPEFAPNL